MEVSELVVLVLSWRVVTIAMALKEGSRLELLE